MSEANVKSAAELLIEARRTRRWLQAFPKALQPQDIAAGYAIQSAVAQRNRRTRLGWKLGATSAEMQARLGVAEPFVGPLYADAIFGNSATVSGCREDMRLVESEFAFILSHDLPPVDGGYDYDAVTNSVGAVLPAIEVVQERFIDPRRSTAAQRVADDAGHGFVVVGLPMPHSIELSQLAGFPVTLTAGFETVAQGCGANVLGDPLRALMWLANWLGSRGEMLCEGDLVISGTCTGVTAVPHDVLIEADFGDGGKVRMILDSGTKAACPSSPLAPEQLRAWSKQ